jgi:hypothetical protein
MGGLEIGESKRKFGTDTMTFVALSYSKRNAKRYKKIWKKPFGKRKRRVRIVKKKTKSQGRHYLIYVKPYKWSD